MNSKFKLKELSIEEEFEHVEMIAKFNRYQAQLLQVDALITENEEEELEKKEICWKIAVIINMIAEEIITKFYLINE